MADSPESEKPAPAVPAKQQPVADLGDLFTKLADPETMKELEANDRRIKEIRKAVIKFDKHVMPVWHTAIQNMTRDIAEIKAKLSIPSKSPGAGERASREDSDPAPPPKDTEEE